MSNINLAYSATGNAFTCTVTTLASGSARESTVVNYGAASPGPYTDVLVFGHFTLAAGSSADDQAIHVYGYGSVDSGITYPDQVTGVNAAITLDNPTQLRTVGTVRTTSGSTCKAGPWSMRAAFGGTMPTHAGIVVRNRSGLTIDAGTISWQGVYEVVL